VRPDIAIRLDAGSRNRTPSSSLPELRSGRGLAPRLEPFRQISLEGGVLRALQTPHQLFRAGHEMAQPAPTRRDTTAPSARGRGSAPAQPRQSFSHRRVARAPYRLRPPPNQGPPSSTLVYRGILAGSSYRPFSRADASFLLPDEYPNRARPRCRTQASPGVPARHELLRRRTVISNDGHRAHPTFLTLAPEVRACLLAAHVPLRRIPTYSLLFRDPLVPHRDRFCLFGPSRHFSRLRGGPYPAPASCFLNNLAQRSSTTTGDRSPVDPCGDRRPGDEPALGPRLSCPAAAPATRGLLECCRERFRSMSSHRLLSPLAVSFLPLRLLHPSELAGFARLLAAFERAAASP